MFNTNETRDKKVNIRFTAEEKEVLEKAAAKRGFKTTSDYIRFLIKKDAKK